MCDTYIHIYWTFAQTWDNMYVLCIAIGANLLKLNRWTSKILCLEILKKSIERGHFLNFKKEPLFK